MWSYRITNIFLLSCLVLSFIDVASSLSCFQCNSSVNSTCADLKQTDLNSHFLRPCEENDVTKVPAFCRKTHLKVKMEFSAGGIHERIIRSCGWKKNTNNKECYRKEDKDHEEIVCQCEHEACNASPSKAAFCALSLLPLILMWLK